MNARGTPPAAYQVLAMLLCVMGGGHPISGLGRGGTPSQVGGYPIPGLGRGGYPIPGLGGGGGYPISGLGRGVPCPRSRWGGYHVPGLGRGVHHLRSG